MPPREEGSSSQSAQTPSPTTGDSPLEDQHHMAPLTTVHRPRVRFHESVRVVLIPHRTEYQEANCSLWYHRLDVFRAQRVAINEIRLLALFQTISLDEAKRKLYQPELDPEAVCWDYLPQGDEVQSSPMLSATSSPDMSLSKQRKSMPIPLNKSKKISCSTHSYEDDDFIFLSPTKLKIPQSTVDAVCLQTTTTSTGGSRSSVGVMDSVVDDHADLHFCVICSDTIPLRIDETKTSSKKLPRHCNRSTSALQQQGFGMLAGCALVTVSIVGFYYVKYFSGSTL